MAPGSEGSAGGLFPLDFASLAYVSSWFEDTHFCAPHTLKVALLIAGQSREPMTTALTGSQVSLAGPSLSNLYKEITWFFSANLTILVQDSYGVMFFKNHLENRVSLGENSALHIHSLRKNDSSEYILRLLKRDGTVEERRVPLRVYGE